MDLKELGSRLKEERERQGLTIEQIMEITKVSRINIVAIECGNQDEFPHEVYAKGFIKNYAKALGLDADEIGEEFSRFMSSGRPDSATDEFNSPEYGPEPKKSSAGTIFLVLILAAIVGGLIYYLHDNSIFSGKSAEKVAVAVVAEEAHEESATAEPAAPVVEEKVEITESEPAATEPEVAEAVTESTPEPAVEQPAVEEQPVAAPLMNVVSITVKPGETCWLRAVVDGEAKEYVLQEGDNISMPYKKSLQIRLGNGGGVEIVSDGKPFKFDAPKGKVKDLEFPAAQ